MKCVKEHDYTGYATYVQVLTTKLLLDNVCSFTQADNFAQILDNIYIAYDSTYFIINYCDKKKIIENDYPVDYDILDVIGDLCIEFSLGKEYLPVMLKICKANYTINTRKHGVMEVFNVSLIICNTENEHIGCDYTFAFSSSASEAVYVEYYTDINSVVCSKCLKCVKVAVEVQESVKSDTEFCYVRHNKITDGRCENLQGIFSAADVIALVGYITTMFKNRDNIINYSPDLFYINNKYTITTNTSTGNVISLYNIYYYENSDNSADTIKIAAAKAEIDNVVQAIKLLVDSCATVYEKLLIVHDYIIEHNSYHYSTSSAVTYAKTDFDMYGALVLGESVCQGYAHAFKYICEELEICDVGFANTTEHIWNQVSIGSSSYNIDCTYDDFTYDMFMKVHHRYFMKSDKSFKSSHGEFAGVYSCTDTRYDDTSLNNIYTHLNKQGSNYYYSTLSGVIGYMNVSADGTLTYANSLWSLPDCWKYTNFVFYPDNNNYVFYNTKDSIRLYDLNNYSYYEYSTPANLNIFGINYTDNQIRYGHRYFTISSNTTVESQSVIVFYTSDIDKIILEEAYTENPLRYIRISRTKLEMDIGDTFFLTGVYYPKDADNVEVENWSSSDTSIVTVNSKGKVTAKASGTAVVTYYVNDKEAQCTITVTTTGLKKINGKWYYYKDGKAVKNKWITIDGKKYYFGNKKYMVTGWKTIKKKRYYFNGKGIMQTGWKTIKRKKYYFNKKGVMQTGWKTIKKKKYYFSKKGVMQTGWVKIKNKRCYFNKKGVYIKKK